MTREEAIKILRVRQEYATLIKEQVLQEAIDMAISALSEAENGCDGCLYEASDGSLFPCNICRLNYGCKYEKDDSKNITESPNGVVEKNDEVIEPSDLISRAEAIEAVTAEGRKVYTSEYANAERIIYEADAVEALAMLPSAEAVQGEWIMHGEPPWYVRECSKCGTKWHQWSGDKTPNYCGHCGAKMKRR